MAQPRPLAIAGGDHGSCPRGERFREGARGAALRLLYRACSHFLYVGRHSREHFMRRGIAEDRLTFAPYCVDASTFRCGEEARARLRGVTRERLGIGDTDHLVLFAGKLSQRKGPDLLLGAVRMLPPKSADACSRFPGQRRIARRAGTNGGGDTGLGARFLGFQNQTQLSPYYHAADLLALPSLHSETWGLVVNEALHHGLPSVVSDAVGCAPDLIEPGVRAKWPYRIAGEPVRRAAAGAAADGPRGYSGAVPEKVSGYTSNGRPRVSRTRFAWWRAGDESR